MFIEVSCCNVLSDKFKGNQKVKVDSIWHIYCSCTLPYYCIYLYSLWTHRWCFLSPILDSHRPDSGQNRNDFVCSFAWSSEQGHLPRIYAKQKFPLPVCENELSAQKTMGSTQGLNSSIFTMLPVLRSCPTKLLYKCNIIFLQLFLSSGYVLGIYF